MRSLTFATIIAVLAVCPLSLLGQEKKTPKKMDAHQTRKMVLKRIKEGANASPVQKLASAAEVANLLEGKSIHAPALQLAVETRRGIDEKIQKIYTDLMFQPRKEAESPAGFPKFTPVGMIEVKSYPGHRLVRTKMAGMMRDQRAFWRLFNHIKKNEIAMTSPVPVERGMESNKDGMTMAFLYGDESLGKLKKEGNVEVIDEKPIMVASIGVRGYDTKDAREAALKAVQNWLKANKKLYKEVGGWRTMGWNGPMVRGSQRYFEVQVPVTKRIPAKKVIVQKSAR